jgi:hypothetical protein
MLSEEVLFSFGKGIQSAPSLRPSSTPFGAGEGDSSGATTDDKRPAWSFDRGPTITSSTPVVSSTDPDPVGSL